MGSAAELSARREDDDRDYGVATQDSFQQGPTSLDDIEWPKNNENMPRF
jgi:hypothetical protein